MQVYLPTHLGHRRGAELEQAVPSVAKRPEDAGTTRTDAPDGYAAKGKHLIVSSQPAPSYLPRFLPCTCSHIVLRLEPDRVAPPCSGASRKPTTQSESACFAPKAPTRCQCSTTAPA